MKILFIVYEEPTNPMSFPLGVGLLSAVLKVRGHEVHGLYIHENLDAAVALDAIVAQVKTYAPSLRIHARRLLLRPLSDLLSGSAGRPE